MTGKTEPQRKARRAAEFEEAEASSTSGLEHPADQEAKAANTSGTEPARPASKRKP